MAAADIARKSFAQLQLKTLRLLGGMMAFFMALRLLLPSPDSEETLSVGRLLVVLLGMYVNVVPDERTVERHGVLLVVLCKVMTTLKALASPPAEVSMITVCFGLHRLLPFCAAVFGGVRFCLGLTAWTVIDVVAIAVWRRLELTGGTLAWPSLDEVLKMYLTDREAAVVWTEVNIVCLAAGLACAIVHTHHQTMSQLVDALMSRQQFISNMVRGNLHVVCWCQFQHS